MHETKVKVRYAETDQMGIVHHSNYYIWFEFARGEFINSSGVSYTKIEEEGVMLPLVESQCKYIKGAKYEDELTIRTSVEKLTGAKIVFNYEITRDNDGALIATGSTTHAFVTKDFRLVNIKKQHPNIWKLFHRMISKDAIDEL